MFAFLFRKFRQRKFPEIKKASSERTTFCRGVILGPENAASHCHHLPQFLNCSTHDKHF